MEKNDPHVEKIIGIVDDIFNDILPEHVNHILALTTKILNKIIDLKLNDTDQIATYSIIARRIAIRDVVKFLVSTMEIINDNNYESADFLFEDITKEIKTSLDLTIKLNKPKETKESTSFNSEEITILH